MRNIHLPNWSHQTRLTFSMSMMIAIVMYILPLPAIGQSPLDAPAALDLKAASFAEAVVHLGEKYRISILADGLPLLERSDLAVAGSLRKVLDRLAQTFDYSWITDKSGVVLMNKRFSNQDDRPQMVLGELRQTAKDMLVVLPAVEPDPGPYIWKWVGHLKSLAGSLTPQQAEALKNGAPLMAKDLGPAQRAILEQVVLTRSFGVPRGVWEIIHLQLQNIEDSRIETQDAGPSKPASPVKILDVAHVARLKDGRSFAVPLGRVEGDPSQEPVQTGSRNAPEQQGADKRGDRSLTPARSKVAEESGKKGEGLDAVVTDIAGWMSLGELVAELCRQSGLRVEVSEPLRERRMLVCAKRVPAGQLLDAVAALNDWTWEEREAKRYAIRRRAPRRFRDLASIPRAMQAALPMDVRAFMHLADLKSIERYGHYSYTHSDVAASLINKERSRLAASLRARLLQRGFVPFSDLNAKQRADLLCVLLFWNCGDLLQILNDDFGVHRIEPDRVEITLENGTMLILDMYDDPERKFHIGFGTDVRAAR